MSYIGTQPTPQSLESRQEFTATASQTTFATSGYTVGYVDVYLNGVKLSTSDFTATNGSDVVLGSGAAAGDVLAVVMKNDHSDLVALPITDSQGNNVLSESGSVVTLTADEANVGSNALVVDSSGNVGVGTNVPYSELTVIGSNSSSQVYKEDPVILLSKSAGTRVLDEGPSIGFNSGISFLYGAIKGAAESSAAEFSGYLSFYTTEATSAHYERMRIDSSGKVLINEQNRWRGSGQISMSLSSDDGISIKTPDAGLIVRKSSYTNNYLCLWENNSGSIIGSITTDGSSTSYVTASDYRLKENITEITDGINRVKQLNPSRFNFISDPDKIVDGFIAHEVSDIVPEAISGEKDAVNEDGSINPQGIDQSKLVPLLTAALQESIALIESQQSQIDTLTTRIEALEATP